MNDNRRDFLRNSTYRLRFPPAGYWERTNASASLDWAAGAA
jgi:hypothetical protein